GLVLLRWLFRWFLRQFPGTNPPSANSLLAEDRANPMLLRDVTACDLTQTGNFPVHSMTLGSEAHGKMLRHFMIRVSFPLGVEVSWQQWRWPIYQFGLSSL